jgi:hypothetical protein
LIGSRIVLVGAIGAIAGCGGSTSPGLNQGGGQFSATIDGVAWSSPALYQSGTATASGSYTFSGTTGSSNPVGMAFSLYWIGAPGTYPLGVGGTVPGGIANITSGAVGWSTPLSGAAGTVTITAVSATRIAGQFSYIATPLFGSPTNNRTVTNGVFDLPVQSSGTITVPDNAGSRFGGTLGGAAWNAATVVMVAAPSTGTLAVGASNDVHSINLIISGITGAGTYTLGTGVSRTVQLSVLGTTQVWGGTANGSGSVVLTSITSTRVKGSYDVTLQPAGGGAAGAKTLTGTFDIGIP